MARKLKSDKALFIATILLVGLSIVMVYSASAPLALQKYGRASMFLVRQAMWALMGLSLLYIVMRIDYRRYREPAFIWTCLAIVAFGLIAVFFRAPDEFQGVRLEGPGSIRRLVIASFVLDEAEMDRIARILGAALPAK